MSMIYRAYTTTYSEEGWAGDAFLNTTHFTTESDLHNTYYLSTSYRYGTQTAINVSPKLHFVSPAMNAILKAGKNILNALAFANADNYSEFQHLLSQTQRNEPSVDTRVPLRLVVGITERGAAAPANPRLRQAA